MDNLLYLVHRIPYPPNKGDKIRSYNFLKHLVSQYHVHLGTFVDEPNDWQYTENLDAICAQTCYVKLDPFRAKIKSLTGLMTGDALSLPYYKSRTLQTWVNQTVKTHKIKKILVFSSAMAQFIEGFLSSDNNSGIDIVVDFVDVDSDKWRQYAEKKQGWERWVYRREAKFLFDYEQKIAQLAKASLFVSEQEAALFKTLAPALDGKTHHIYNGVDTDYFSSGQAPNSPFPDNGFNNLVFTGAMDYWANVDAVVWFAREVLPAVLKACPNTKFYIVGSKPTKDVEALASDQVIVTGSVPDVRPFVAHATVSVAPLRIARGIQNKVLEAMALSKYIVATSAAMEGIPYGSNELALSVTDDADQMAANIIGLLQNKPTAAASAVNREFVKMTFSWGHSGTRLCSFLNGSSDYQL